MGEKRKHSADKSATHHEKRHHEPKDHTAKRRRSEKKSTDTVLKDLNERHPHTRPSAHVPPYTSPQQEDIPDTTKARLPALPTIADEQLAAAVFTHTSTQQSKYSTVTHLNYERLEFLGDAYLEIIATRIIFSRFPELLSGKQAQLRERLIKNTTLAEFARRYGFQDKIHISEQVLQGLAWGKVLADVFEAYIAATILADPKQGFQRVETWLEELWAPMLLKEDPQVLNVDAKTLLAQKVSGKHTTLDYREEKPMEMFEKGYQRHFIAVYFTGWGCENVLLGRGKGASKKEAGMLAAWDAVQNNSALVAEVAEKKRLAYAARQNAETGAAEGVAST